MRWKSLGLGVAAFTLAHLVEMAAWSSLFGGNAFAPWFLNSSRAGAFTALTLAVVAALTATRENSETLVRGLNVGLGAAAAMILVLMAIGPGTLFPIALAVGLAIVVTASVAGALAGAFLKGAATRTRRSHPSSDS